MLSEAIGVVGQDIMFSSNETPAEEYAYADISYTEMVLVDKWKTDEGKEMVTFVDGDAIEFTTNKKRFPALRNSHIGQVWNLYSMSIKKQNNTCKIRFILYICHVV